MPLSWRFLTPSSASSSAEDLVNLLSAYTAELLRDYRRLQHFFCQKCFIVKIPGSSSAQQPESADDALRKRSALLHRAHAVGLGLEPLQLLDQLVEIFFSDDRFGP